MSSSLISCASAWNQWMNSDIFFNFYLLQKRLYKLCHQPNPQTTCKAPPALSGLIKLPSSNVTWMSDRANASTSLAVGKRHLMQPRKAMRAVTDFTLLDDVGTTPTPSPSSLSSTATFQLLADWAEQPGLAALQRGHWQPCRPGAAPLCRLKWGHLKDGDLRGCVSKSTRES